MDESIYKKSLDLLKKDLHYMTVLMRNYSPFQPEIRQAIKTSAMLIGSEILKVEKILKGEIK